MKYDVIYMKPKKKGYAKETATFLKIDDAIFWENYVRSKGAKEVTIQPK